MLGRLFQRVKGLGVGRVLIGTAVALMLGGPALGVLAATDTGGVRFNVVDAVRQGNSDEDDDFEALGPDPEGPNGDGSPDSSASADSSESPGATDTSGSADTP